MFTNLRSVFLSTLHIYFETTNMDESIGIHVDKIAAEIAAYKK